MTLGDSPEWMFYVAAFRETAGRVQKDLEAKGVQVACGQMLDHIEQEGGRLTAVMQNGRRFTADTIAVCIGVRRHVGSDRFEAMDTQCGIHRNIGVWFNANKQGRVAGANMAGSHMEFDANVLVNLAHYLDYDFISIGDISACKPEDEVYEYEDQAYYIRAVRSGREIRCINVIGSADSNGVIKNAFIKAVENRDAPLDIQTVCFLKAKGFPDRFIDFLGGKTVD